VANGEQADVLVAGWSYDVKVKVAGTDTVVSGVGVSQHDGVP
jgi:hypothetical protein